MAYTFNPFTGTFDNTPVVPQIAGVYLPLSGGVVTGNFSVSGLTTLSGTTIIGSDDYSTLYVDSNKVGINTETPNEALTVVGNISSTGNVYGIIEGLGVDTEVRNLTSNWESTYSTVQSNSATTWNYQGTDLKDLSANWENTYTTVQSKSSIDWDNNLVTQYVISNYLPLSGGTLTGKLTLLNPSTTESVLNIGVEASNPNILAVGDLWGTSAGLFYRSAPTITRTLAVQNGVNSFSRHQVIDALESVPALRVTQRGTGNALVVEDETTPDNTPFIVDNMGSVGIGLSSVAGIDAKLTVVGNVSATGTVYTNNKQAVTTNTTNVAGTSAVTTILAVSAVPVSPDPNTLYIVI